MIYIKIILSYGKLIGIFLLLELLISFILGFLNLIGLNSFISCLILLIFNILSAAIYGYIFGKKTNKKGFIEGIIVGFMLVFICFILSVLVFHSKLSYGTLFYYLSIIIITIISATIGKNKKEEATLPEKK